MVFLEGYALGLALIVFIGPVFFTLLKSTLQYGVLSGLWVALGIFISDVVCVLFCTFGAAAFFKDQDNQFWIGIIGGLLLIGMGLKYLLFPTLTKQDTQLNLKASDYLGFFAKGFLVNFVNPFVFLVWIGIIKMASVKYGGFNQDLGIYLTGALLGILTTDSAKAFFGHRLKVFLNPNFLRWVYRSIGVLLIVFGIRMMYMVAL